LYQAKKIPQLIKNIRGNDSQAELTDQLNLAKNTVNKWENNKKSIKWNNFVNLCLIKNIPLKKILNKVLSNELNSLHYSDILFYLFGQEDLTIVSTKSGISYNTIYNWTHKEVEPSLNHLLTLFDHYTIFGTSLFFDGISDHYEDKLCLDNEYPTRSLIYNNPRSLLLIKVLELSKFKLFSYDQFEEIAKITSLPLYEIKEKIKFLIENNLVIKIGDKLQFVRHENSLAANRNKFIQIVRFWFKESIRLLSDNLSKNKTLKNSSVLSFGMYNFDDKTIDEANELTRKYILDLKNISFKSDDTKHCRAAIISLNNPIKE